MVPALPYEGHIGDRGATFSPCGHYRYTLWRQWDPAVAPVVFLMLNPSTADATSNDPTVERCERRARAWRAGGLIVLNLFAFRSTDPAKLRRVADPIGPENMDVILRVCAGDTPCGRWPRLLVVCAWGVNAEATREDWSWTVVEALMAMGVELSALRVTIDGAPAHPLYLPYTLQPVEWHPARLGAGG